MHFRMRPENEAISIIACDCNAQAIKYIPFFKNILCRIASLGLQSAYQEAISYLYLT